VAEKRPEAYPHCEGRKTVPGGKKKGKTKKKKKESLRRGRRNYEPQRPQGGRVKVTENNRERLSVWGGKGAHKRAAASGGQKSIAHRKKKKPLQRGESLPRGERQTAAGAGLKKSTPGAKQKKRAQ